MCFLITLNLKQILGHVIKYYTSIAWICINNIRKAQAQIELHLTRNMKGNKKAFYKFIRSMEKTKATVGPLLHVEGKLVVDDAVKVEMFNVSFHSLQNVNYQMMYRVPFKDKGWTFSAE